VTELTLWALTAVGSIAALVQAFLFYKAMLRQDPGTPAMIEIAEHVRVGAAAYLRQQYKIVAVYFVIVAGLLAYCVYIGIQATFVPIAFLTGGFWSGVAAVSGRGSRDSSGCGRRLRRAVGRLPEPHDR